MNIDQGTDFGRWDDETSKFIYHTSTKEILSMVDIPESVVDLGGGNGLLKEFIPNLITVDIDPEKKPDVLMDIFEYDKIHDMVIIRYVLHYLNDIEVIRLMKHAMTIANQVLTINIVNNDLKGKYENSINETKYFRTSQQLSALIPDDIHRIYRKSYMVSREFYKNRLNNPNGKAHFESIEAHLIK